MINLKKNQVTVRTNFSHAKAAFWQIRGLGFLLNLYSYVFISVRCLTWIWVVLQTALLGFWIRLDQVGSNWIRLDQIGTDWIRLDQIESGWIRMDQIWSDHDLRITWGWLRNIAVNSRYFSSLLQLKWKIHNPTDNKIHQLLG